MKSIIYSGLLFLILVVMLSTNQLMRPTSKEPKLNISEMFAGITATPSIESTLSNIQRLELPIETLKVTSNICPNWGGDLISIEGNGKVTFETHSNLPPLIKRKIPKYDIYRLVDLLIAKSAWKQNKQPEQFMHDCKATIIIEYPPLRTEIWEWRPWRPANKRTQLITQFIVEITDKR